jgi:uncharacterized RDD family membrane protein YckC
VSTAPHESTCPTCGAALEPGAVFCAECGARVGAAQPVVPSPYSAGLAPPPPPGPAPAVSPPPARRPVPSASYPVAPDSVASIGSRALAYAIDGLVLLGAYGIGYGIVAATGGMPTTTEDLVASRAALLLPGILGLLVGISQWVAEAITGATVGNAVTGIRTVSNRTGRPAGLLAILVRQLVIAVGFLVCLVGEWVVVVSGTWDSSPSQRGWHDKAAGTLVLRARSIARAPSAAQSAAWNTAVARTMGDAAPGSVPALVPAAPGPAAPSRPVPALVADPPSGPAVVADPPSVAGIVTGAPGADPVPEFLVPLAPVRRVADPPPTTRRAARLADSAAGEVITGMPGASTGTPAPAARAQPVIDVPHSRPDSSPPPRVSLADADLGELEHTRLRPSAPAPTAAVRPAPVLLRLSFDTGERIDVTGDGLVGRSPAAEEGTAHVVPVDDPARSISKTHLAFGLEGAGDRLWVMDRGSTNGTVLVAPDGTSSVLPEGTRATVAAGWTIRFGQRSAVVERR